MAAGAAVTLVVAGIPIVAVRILVGSQAEGAERNLWVVPVLALFAAFAVGGHRAARGQPAAPYVHAAASATLAFAAFFCFTVARRLVTGEGLTTALLVTMGLLLQISVCFALGGGYVAWRRSRRKGAPDPEAAAGQDDEVELSR